jgi:hypothetical protein
MSNLFKDHMHKHKKEKIVDSYLIKEEKKYVKELSKKVEHMEKVAEIKLATKRHREELKDEEPVKVAKVEEANTTNGKNINLYTEEVPVSFAIQKILKHLNKQDKFSKCLELLKTVFSNNLEAINPILVIKVFHSIFNVPFKFLNKSSIKPIVGNYTANIIDLYNYVKAENDKKSLLGPFYTDIFSQYNLIIKYQVNLMTDDSFIFNASMRKVEGAIEECNAYSQAEEDRYNSFISRLESDNNYTEIDGEAINLTEEEQGDIVDFMKKKALLECLKQAFQLHKNKWAFATINNLFKKLYKNKSKFSPDQYIELSKMITMMNNAGSLSLDITRHLRDEKIKVNPLQASHIVQDAREEKISFGGGMDAWEAKQSGLTYGKMSINK